MSTSVIMIYRLPAVPKRAVTVLTVAGLIAAGAIVFATQSSSAGTISVTNNELSGLRGVAVDSVHHELFTTNWQGAVDVIDFTGQRIGYVDGDDLSGGGGLALSADDSVLYVTVANKHEIAAVDTTTSKVIAEYPVGDSAMPQQIARAGHTLWFGWVTGAGTPTAGAGIGTLDLTDPTHTVTTWTQVGGTDLIQAPLLTADPGNPDRLALCDPNGGIAVRLVDVSTGTRSKSPAAPHRRPSPAWRSARTAPGCTTTAARAAP
jgi:DNA-binding beta-propeller fold protein YncE